MTGRERVRVFSETGRLDTDPASRQKLIPGWRQDLIRRSKVMVVGVGALGNEVIKNLVLLGVGKLRIIDMDTVEGSNLSRSILFTRQHAQSQTLKVEAAKEGIKRLDPYGYVEVEAINTDITEHDYESTLFEEIDVIFTTLDNLEARLHVNMVAYMKGIPLIDGGMDGAMGHVQTIIPPHTSCLYCSVTDRDMKLLADKLSCEGLPLKIGQPKVPAVITTTSLIAAVMVHEFLKVIHGIEDFKATGKWNPRLGSPLAGKRFFVNLAHNTFIVYEVPISSRCPLHAD